MLSWLIIFFTVVPAMELYLLIRIGSAIGPLNTLLIVIFTGVLGAYLARMEGFLIIQKIQQKLVRGILPGDDLIDGALILAGGILLLTPGFFTDAMGLLMLLPLGRFFVKKYLKHAFVTVIRQQDGAFDTNNGSRPPPDEPPFIDI